MTREQIISALGYCMKTDCSHNCPYYEVDESEAFCSVQLKRDARNLLIEDGKEEDDRK